jgi:hypothetical protein
MKQSNRTKLIQLLGDMTTNDYQSVEEFSSALELLNKLKPITKRRKRRTKAELATPEQIESYHKKAQADYDLKTSPKLATD